MLGSPIDTLGRFKRYRTQRPQGKYIRKAPKLVELLAFLYRHGPLPTNILFEFYGTSSSKMFANYLSRLYDGVCATYEDHVFDDQGKDVTTALKPKHVHQIVQRYLERPRDYRTANLYYDQTVHDLTDEAHILLDAHGHISPHINRTDPDVHRLMGACITSSIELAVRAQGEYISRHRILSKNANKLRIDTLSPDELFGLTANGKQRFFVCEWDRATEALTATSSSRETIRAKLADYEAFIRDRAYSKVWGIDNCRVLFATVGHTRLENVLTLIKNEYPYLANRVYCKTFPAFAGRDWTIPKSAYRDILAGWKSAAGESFDLIETAPR